MKILTVDDSVTARLIVKRTYEGEGHKVLEAADGAAALQMLEQQSPIDAVILDWNMPVMTGIECLHEMRKNAAFKDVKVLMCTTEAEKSSIVTAIKAGANGYLLKPVTPAKLIEQLAKVTTAAA